MRVRFVARQITIGIFKNPGYCFLFCRFIQEQVWNQLIKDFVVQRKTGYHRTILKVESCKQLLVLLNGSKHIWTCILLLNNIDDAIKRDEDDEVNVEGMKKIGERDLEMEAVKLRLTNLTSFSWISKLVCQAIACELDFLMH